MVINVSVSLPVPYDQRASHIDLCPRQFSEVAAALAALVGPGLTAQWPCLK